MSSSVIGSLRANLGLDSAQFERGTKRARSLSQQLARDMRVIGAAGLAVGAALSAMAKRGGDEIDRLAKAGRRLDTGVTGMRAMELAAGEAGVAVGGLTDAVQNLDREVASGAKGATESLARLNLTARDLQGLEADEKLALIADRVKDLGLSTGETSDLLRGFGIRNRDLVLLMGQGGDALRAARKDIEDYGLAVSAVDASKIESANDQIGRLGLISQFAGQELARNLVPAMGRFAQAMTDSLREGGALRTVIEGITSQSQRLVTIAGTAVGAFAAYRTILLGVAAAKWLVVGATTGLRVALLRLGLPALIIGAGEIIYQFGRLSEATGGWGNALSALGDLAAGVWEGIKTSALSIVPALGAIWADIRSSFFGMLEALQIRWAMFLGNIAVGLRQLPFIGDEIADKLAGSVRGIENTADSFGDSARAAGAAANDLRDQASRMASEGFDKARDALARLTTILSETKDEGGEAAEAARRLASAFNEVAGGGGTGGGAAGAADGIDQVADSMDRLDDASREVEGSFQNAFVGIVTGTMKARDAIGRLLQDLARLLAQRAFQSLFGGMFSGGGFFSGLFGGFRADGGPVASGKSYIVGERGPELFTPGASGQITSNENMRGGNEPVQVIVRVLPSGEFDARVENTARAVVRVEGPRQIGAAFERARETRAFG